VERAGAVANALRNERWDSFTLGSAMGCETRAIHSMGTGRIEQSILQHGSELWTQEIEEALYSQRFRLFSGRRSQI